VVTRALPGWSSDLQRFTNYEQRASARGVDHMRLFFAFSPWGANGTTFYGDSGSGVVLRRQRQASGGEVVNGSRQINDVLYGITTWGDAYEYSMKEAGGEPARVRNHGKPQAIPHVLGGEW